MSETVLVVGEKVHIITRRSFQEDLRRHFTGEITAVQDDQFRAEGYVFVFDPGNNAYERRPETRVRVFSTSGAGHIINILPRGVRIKSLQYLQIDGRLKVTDGAGFTLDINEFGLNR